MIYKVLNCNAFESGELNGVFNQLTTAQQNYIKSKNQKSAEQSLAARALLCRILKEFCGRDLAKHISADQNGRLYIDGRPDIFVSISHSKDMIAAAVSKNAVGIDIEHIRPVSEKLQKRVCKEISKTKEAFFKVWTLKEAYLKASGISFSKMLSLDAKAIQERAEVFSLKQDGYWITVVDVTEEN